VNPDKAMMGGAQEVMPLILRHRDEMLQVLDPVVAVLDAMLQENELAVLDLLVTVGKPGGRHFP
jgi:hypothetical protein